MFDLRGGAGVAGSLYDKGGLDALTSRRPKIMKLSPNESDKNLSAVEQELKKLQREVEYLRAQNAYLKKLDDLLRQKEQSIKKN